MKRDHTIAAMHTSGMYRAMRSLPAILAIALLSASAAWSQTGTGQSGQSAPGAGSSAPAQSGTAPASSQTSAPTNGSAASTQGGTAPTGNQMSSTPGNGATPAPQTTSPQGGNVPGSVITEPAGSAGTVLSLAQTIQMALDASSQLKIAGRNLDKDQALIDQAEAGNRPRLNATGTEVYLSKPVKISFNGSSPILVQPIDTQTISGVLSLPIDITGQVRAQIEAARLSALIDVYTRDRIANQRILDAETAYLTLLRAQHQVDVAQAALNNAQTQDATTQKQFAGGIGQRIDVYRAATQVAQSQQQVLAAQNQLAVAQNNLNDLIGRPMASPVTVQDVTGVDVGVDIAGGAITPGTNPNTLVTPQQNLPKLYTPAPLPSMTIDQSVQTAMSSRPELLADQVSIEAAHRQIKIAHAGQEPTLSLGATGNYYPTTDFSNPYHNLNVFTATVNIPLYDGGITRDKVREAKDTEANEKDQYSGDQSDVELQVRQAYLNLGTARQQIDSANTALQQAIIARQLAQVRYANGVGLYLEVTDAQSALTSAETDQVNAVYDYLIAEAQFENAIGMPNRSPSL